MTKSKLSLLTDRTKQITKHAFLVIFTVDPANFNAFLCLTVKITAACHQESIREYCFPIKRCLLMVMITGIHLDPLNAFFYDLLKKNWIFFNIDESTAKRVINPSKNDKSLIQLT